MVSLPTPTTATTTTTGPSTVDRREADRRLRFAAACFTVAVLLHNGDHLRRGPGSTAADVVAAGTSSVLLEVAVVVLIVAGHRLAPLVAVAAGAGLAAGYVAVHLLPARSWLSDPLFSGGASALSQGAAVLEIIAAVVLAAAGWRALQSHGGLASAGTGGRAPSSGAVDVTWARAWRSPVVLAMVLGNAGILVGTLVGG